MSELRYCVLMRDFRVVDKREFPLVEQPRELYEAGYFPYQGTYYQFIFMALEYLQKNYAAASLIDVGAGCGRVIRVARILGFKRVDGIEISPSFFEVCRKMLTKDTCYSGHSTLVCRNLERYTPSIAYDVMFAFNPAAASVFVDLFVRMSAQNVMPRLIVLVNPVLDETLRSFGYTSAYVHSTNGHTEFCIYTKCS